jgi:hypothetical protein
MRLVNLAAIAFISASQCIPIQSSFGQGIVSGARSEVSVAFANALQKISDGRSKNSANEFGCTQYFSEFYQSKKIEPYVAFFQSRDIAPIIVDQNQEHFVSFELTGEKLAIWGYRGFRRRDRLVLVFTTASASSADITSFSARLFGADLL